MSSKVEIFKNYIKFKSLIEAKNNGHTLIKEYEDFIDKNRQFLIEDDKENNKLTRSKPISKIKNNDVYRECYKAVNPGLNIGTLICQISQKLGLENHLGALYNGCSEIAHFNPMALHQYMIQDPDTLYFDSANIDLIGTSLLLAINCACFSVDVLANAFKLDISDFQALIKEGIGAPGENTPELNSTTEAAEIARADSIKTPTPTPRRFDSSFFNGNY